jgi:hypothetical protein
MTRRRHAAPNLWSSGTRLPLTRHFKESTMTSTSFRPDSVHTTLQRGAGVVCIDMIGPLNPARVVPTHSPPLEQSK